MPDKQIDNFTKLLQSLREKEILEPSVSIGIQRGAEEDKENQRFLLEVAILEDEKAKVANAKHRDNYLAMRKNQQEHYNEMLGAARKGEISLVDEDDNEISLVRGSKKVKLKPVEVEEDILIKQPIQRRVREIV